MAHKKGASRSRNGRDSHAQPLGVKRFGGQHGPAGEIIIRQRGTKFHPGDLVGRGGDDTLFALAKGNVQFGTRRGRKTVSVVPVSEYFLRFSAPSEGPGAGSRHSVVVRHSGPRTSGSPARCAFRPMEY